MRNRGVTLLEVSIAIVVIGALFFAAFFYFDTAASSEVTVENNARLLSENMQWARLLAMTKGHDYGVLFETGNGNPNPGTASNPYIEYDIRDCANAVVDCKTGKGNDNLVPNPDSPTGTSYFLFGAEVGNATVLVTGINNTTPEQFFRFHADGSVSVYSTSGSPLSGTGVQLKSGSSTFTVAVVPATGKITLTPP